MSYVGPATTKMKRARAGAANLVDVYVARRIDLQNCSSIGKVGGDACAGTVNLINDLVAGRIDLRNCSTNMKDVGAGAFGLI